MIARVAMAYGQSFASVVQAPYPETVAAFIALQEVERIDDLLAELEANNDAYRMNAAFAGNDSLKKERSDIMSRLRRRADGSFEPLSDRERSIIATILQGIQAQNESAARTTA